MTVPNARPEPNPDEEHEAEIQVGTPIPQEALREALGSFGDTEDDDEGGIRPEQVALNKTRTWG